MNAPEHLHAIAEMAARLRTVGVEVLEHLYEEGYWELVVAAGDRKVRVVWPGREDTYFKFFVPERERPDGTEWLKYDFLTEFTPGTYYADCERKILSVLNTYDR